MPQIVATYCDRCGKLISGKRIVVQVIAGSIPRLVRDRHIRFCEPCAGRFGEFLGDEFVVPSPPRAGAFTLPGELARLSATAGFDTDAADADADHDLGGILA